MDVATFYAEPHLDTSDGFGSTLNRPHPHRGFDVFKWAEGTPVPAWSPGQVTRVYRSTALGNVVVVHTSFGWVGYCHLASTAVSEGQTVGKGDIVGALGQTGTAAVGPHLHTTVSLTGDDPGTSEVVDPLPYIRQYRDGDVPQPENGDDEMLYKTFVHADDGGAYLYNTQTGKYVHIQNPDDLSIITRVIAPGSDLGRTYTGQLDVFNRYAAQVNDHPQTGTANIDADALATAIVSKLGSNLSLSVDTAGIKSVVEAALQGDFKVVKQ